MAPRTVLTACLLIAACSDDGPPAGSPASPTEVTTGSLSATASTAVSAPTSAPQPGTAPPEARGVCEDLGADDLRAWYGWRTVGELQVTSPSNCTLRLGDGQRVTIRSGTAESFGDRLARFAGSGTPLADFDPTRPESSTAHFDAGRTTAVATDGENIVIVDNRSAPSLVPSFPRTAQARFLVERLVPIDLEDRSQRLDLIRPVRETGCQNLTARDPHNTVELALIPSGLSFTSTFRGRGELGVGDGLIGAVTFGRDLDAGRCSDPPDGRQPVVTSVWPLANGTARYRFRPSDACLDVRLTVTDLEVERPDGARIALADMTMRNRAYGRSPPGVCLYPSTAP